jgi:multiple sugar transport system substrate-binding protein
VFPGGLGYGKPVRSARHRFLARLTAILLLGGCAPTDPGAKQPEAIDLLIASAERLKNPISDRLMGFQRKTGIRVNLHTVPEVADIFPISQSPNHGLDVVDALNIWVGDFVNSGFIEPLDAWIKADMNDPDLKWDDISTAVQAKNRWGGRYYSMICDNDNMFLIYRKDVLADPANRDLFMQKKGYPLPNPPQTIDQLVDVAEVFDNRDWDHSNNVKRSFAIDTVDDLMQWYALGVTAPYTVMDIEVVKDPAHSPMTGGKGGLFLFKPDMTPLVNTPGFKLGIARYLELARHSDKLKRQDVIDKIVRGEALMAIDWGDTGPNSLRSDSMVKGRLGFALTPGTTSYWDWVTNNMVDTSPSVHVAPLHQANGFAFFMTSTSDHKDAVWRFIKYMNSPEISMGIVSDPRGGYQPWRNSHTDLNRWEAVGWDRESADNYVRTILDTSNHKNASLDVRMPGVGDYYTTLRNHLQRLLSSATPQMDVEMDGCAADMQAITRDNLVEAQTAAYLRHLDLSQ